MTNFEMVEMLRQKANVSYEEAKAALEQANWDLLDAMVLLEKDGKVIENGGSYSTRPEEEPVEEETNPKHRGEAGARNALKWLGETFLKLLRMGNANFFVVSRAGNELISLPVTVFVVLLIFCNWFALAALVIGLFCDLRYSFRGPNLGKDAINAAMDRASDVAENVKEEFRSSVQNEKKQEDGEDK